MAWKKDNKGWNVEKGWYGEEPILGDFPLENEPYQPVKLPSFCSETSTEWGKKVTPDHIKRDLSS